MFLALGHQEGAELTARRDGVTGGAGRAGDEEENKAGTPSRGQRPGAVSFASMSSNSRVMITEASSCTRLVPSHVS